MTLYTLPKEIHALIASYLPDSSGNLMRILANDMIVKTIISDCTYANGLLHSFNDEPIIATFNNLEIMCQIPNVNIDDSVWFSHGMIHRTGNLPAVLSHDQASYYIHGKLHRDNDLPAIITNNYSIWYQHGNLHRDNNLPAIITSTYSIWYKHGQRHRDNGPAYINMYGIRIWYCNGDKHRDNDLPAYVDETLNYSAWYQHGKLHRIGGPAVIYSRYYTEYYIDGVLCKYNYSFSVVASLILGITISIAVKRYFN